ncbi:MAG TPA: glycosyltransferase family 4 protein [Bacteroidales bacterium]|nr:glycosyltransferase family 4 protein [Bacteroidales bacterium]HPS18169.1 glycosyltransferase family 4 protein [Bacteroidales bacterium]
MKKVLIITYYWPPCGGSGVQRWLKFVKYLRNFGWEPIIYTPENPEMSVIDNSLLKDLPENLTVIKTKIWEPYNFYKAFIGKKKSHKINTALLSESKKPKLTEKISVWIRGNFFIPDARRFWIKPSVKFLKEYLKSNKVDAIVSNGPPHSMHMIALGLKKSLNIPWLADFRDPWTNIDFYHELMLSGWADKRHHKMENKVLKNADAVTVISRSMAEDMKRLHNRKYEVITNGYDEETNIEDVVLDKKFSIAHIGSLVKSRNPEVLWKVLNFLLNDRSQNSFDAERFSKDLEIKLVGKVDFSVKESIKKYKLENYINYIDYLPHDEVIRVQQQSQVLLLLLNNTPNAKMILTGKFFEYLAAKRPVLCIGPTDGDAAEIINETKCGVISDFDDFEHLRDSVINFYKSFCENSLDVNSAGIEKYSRKNLTFELSKILNKIVIGNYY